MLTEKKNNFKLTRFAFEAFLSLRFRTRQATVET